MLLLGILLVVSLNDLATTEVNHLSYVSGAITPVSWLCFPYSLIKNLRLAFLIHMCRLELPGPGHFTGRGIAVETRGQYETLPSMENTDMGRCALTINLPSYLVRGWSWVQSFGLRRSEDLSLTTSRSRVYRCLRCLYR